MILLVGFYEDADDARTAEFVECVRRNCVNPGIDRIVVFIEDSVGAEGLRRRRPVFAESKVYLVEHGRRLSFADLFEYANRHLAGAAVTIANADIFFDETLTLLDSVPLAGRLLCLSRWDEQEDGTARHFDNPYSQDAWIFEAPVQKFSNDFGLGMPGCDNRLAYEAERAGLVVSNPSRSIRARHLHRSAVRRYTDRDRLHGPNRHVPASFLDVAGPAAGRPSASDFPSHRGRRADVRIDARHGELLAVLAPYLGGVVPQALRAELRRALAQRDDAPAPPSNLPLATVAFRESMGYTLARLALGVSTHNNDTRPLVSIPSALRGMRFTQVVANRSAPVEITFRSAGRLFVLAAPGWEGYKPAATLLDDAGYREPIEALCTRDGTRFEVWSLAAGAGERIVVPTQVMLAAEELVRNC